MFLIPTVDFAPAERNVVTQNLFFFSFFVPCIVINYVMLTNRMHTFYFLFLCMFRSRVHYQEGFLYMQFLLCVFHVETTTKCHMKCKLYYIPSIHNYVSVQ